MPQLIKNLFITVFFYLIKKLFLKGSLLYRDFYVRVCGFFELLLNLFIHLQ